MSSRGEAQALRVQLEEQRERARKEMQEVQRHGNDAQSELERSHINLRRLEEEVCVFDLSVCVHACLPAGPLRYCFYYENDVWSETVLTHNIHGACLTDYIHASVGYNMQNHACFFFS